MKIYPKLLLAFLPASLFAIAVSGYLLFTSAEQALSKQVFNQLISVASIQKNRIEDMLTQTREQLSLISSRTELRLSLDKFLQNRAHTHQLKMNRILADAQGSVGSFKSISVLSPDGMVVASTDTSMIGTFYAKQAQYLLNPLEIAVPRFFHDAQGQLQMTWSGPLYLQNKFIGVVVIVSDLSNIVALLGDYSGMGKTGESYLVADDGDGGILFLTPLRFDPDAAFKRVMLTPKPTSPVMLALAGKEVLITDTIDYRGQVALIVTKHIEHTGWGLVAEIDKSEAFEPIKDLKIFLTVILLSTSLFIILVSVFLSRMITRPISALTSAASESEKENGFPKAVEIYSQDELGTLSQAFNRMTGRLKEANSSLEEKVRELNNEITERQRVEQQFVQAQKMEAMGTLVGGLAHDFNNILAGIMANTYLLKERVTDEGTLKYIEDTSGLSQRAADLIRQLLAFARKDKVTASVFTLTEFIHDTLKLALVAMPEHVRVDCTVEQEELAICCDATQLQQVVLNLLNNARDAVKSVDEPHIEIKVNAFEADDHFRLAHQDVEASKFARISVHDNGHGIDRDYLEKIFEPFFTTKEVGEGTGLGLSMAYSCVTRFGGMIEVESENGSGCTFHVYIPLSSEPLENSARTDDEVPDLTGITLLLADDEASLREAISEAMTQLGCHVLQAGDGLQAIRTFEASSKLIDVVVLDMAMPNINGLKTAQQLRLLRPDMPIVFITGYEEDILAEVQEMPNTSMLNKPFSIEMLSRSVLQLIPPGNKG